MTCNMPETENSTIAKKKNSHKDLLTVEGLCSRLREDMVALLVTDYGQDAFDVRLLQ